MDVFGRQQGRFLQLNLINSVIYQKRVGRLQTVDSPL